jgi:hypothetical protein
MPSEPSEQDRRNAALRASIAARFRKEFEDALALLEIALGTGWEPISTTRSSNTKRPMPPDRITGGCL